MQFLSSTSQLRRRRRTVPGVAALALIVAPLTAASVAAAATPAGAATPSPARIGAAPRLPRGAVAAGTLAAGTVLHVDVVLQPRDPAALAQFATSVSTPGSPLYRHFLARGQFASTFGPTSAAIAAVESSLRAAGLHPGAISANHLSIPVTATAAQLSRAFSTSFEQVRVGGRLAYSNTAAPLLAGSAKGFVQGVIGLDDLAVPQRNIAHATPGSTPRPRTGRAAVTPDASGPTACSAANTEAGKSGAYTSSELASAYGFSNLYGSGDLGTGVTAAILELEPFSATDVSTFQTCYGTSASVSIKTVDGGAGSGAGSGESALDIETLISFAPKATVQVYEAPDSTLQDALDGYTAIVDADQAKVISTSWGLCEGDLSSSFVSSEDDVFAQAVVQGQSVFAAAGDYGSEDCDDPTDQDYEDLYVDDPAGQPDVTGVGGTYMPSLTNLSGTQSVWDDGDGSGGGGTSDFWSWPSYQSGATGSLGVDNGYSDGYREVPDVSADAAPIDGIVLYYNGAWTSEGGTSIGAPLWAALWGLVDVYGTGACTGSVGFANPALYEAAGQAYSSVFSNEVQGSNDNNDYTGYNDGWYPALPEYSMATGLGTPNAYALANQVCDRAPNAPSGVSATQGSESSAGNGQVDVSWSAPSSNGSAITGYTVTPNASCVTSCSVSMTSSTSALVTGLVPDRSDTFSVTATNGIGTGSAGTSNAITPVTIPGAPPSVGVTQGSGATPGAGQVVVSWSAAAANDPSGVSYTVSSSPSCPSCPFSTSGTSATVSGLSTASTYSFSVTATNGVGTGAQTTSAGITPKTVPSAPGNVSATAGQGGSGDAVVTWTAASPYGSPVSLYTVTASPACSCGTLTTSGLTTTLTGLSPTQTYTVDVTATNGVGTGPASSTTVNGPPTVPSAPSFTAVPEVIASTTAGVGKVSLSWSVPADNGASISSYIVTSSPACGCGGLTSNTNSTTVTGLIAGDSYFFRVAAVNSVGTGVLSTDSNTVMPYSVPSAPASVNVSAGSGATAGDGQVDLSWPASSANGAGILGYVVTASPSCPACGGTSSLGTSTLLTGLTPGVSYTFGVVAHNVAGPGPSGGSAPIVPATIPGAPGAISLAAGPTTTPGDGQARLSWGAAPDNGSAVTRYSVTVASPGCSSCRIAVSGTAATVTGMAPATTYVFDVTAANQLGTGATAHSGGAVVYTVPSAPGAVAARASSAGMTVTFSAPAVNGGAALAYVVAISPACTTCHGTTTSTLSTVVTGLKQGAAYRFAVHAVNRAGAGGSSAYSPAVVFPFIDGYWLATRNGHVFAFGAAHTLANTTTSPSDPVVGITGMPNGSGYFVVTAHGTVTVAGRAPFKGDLAQEHIARSDIVSIVATIDGNGYWLVGADGEVYAFGDAPNHGDLLTLPHPVLVSNIVGMVACAGDAGYLLLGSDGGVFAFARTHYYGSLPGLGIKVNDIRGILPSATNTGYVLVGADGGAFVFGTGTRYYGSLPGRGIKVSDIVGLAITPTSQGYYMAGSNGAVYGFGDAIVFADPRTMSGQLPVAGIAGV